MPGVTLDAMSKDWRTCEFTQCVVFVAARRVPAQEPSAMDVEQDQPLPSVEEPRQEPAQQLFTVTVLCAPAKFRFSPFFERLMPLSTIADLKKALPHLNSIHQDISDQLNANRLAWTTYEHIPSVIYISNDYSGVAGYVSDVCVVLHDKLVHLPVTILKTLMREVSQAIALVREAVPDNLLAIDADAAILDDAPLAMSEHQLEIGLAEKENQIAADNHKEDRPQSLHESESGSDGESSSVNDEDADNRGASSVPSSSAAVAEPAVEDLPDEDVLEKFLFFHTRFNDAVLDECEQLIASEAQNDTKTLVDTNGEQLQQYVTDAEESKYWEQFIRDVPADRMDIARQAFNEKWKPLEEAEVEKDLKQSAGLRGGPLKPRRKAAARRRSVKEEDYDDDNESDSEAGEYNTAAVRKFRGREFHGRVAGVRSAGDRITGEDDEESSGSLSGTTVSDTDEEAEKNEIDKTAENADGKKEKKKSRKRKRRRQSSPGTPSEDAEEGEKSGKRSSLKKRSRQRSPGSRSSKSPLAFDDDGKPSSIKSTESECLFLGEKQITTPQKKPSQSQAENKADDTDDVEVLSQTIRTSPTFFGSQSRGTKKRYHQKNKKRQNLRKKYAGFDAATKRVIRESKKHSKAMSEKRVRIQDQFGDDSGVLDVVEPAAQLQQAEGSGSQQQQLSVSVDPGLWKCLKRHQKAGVGFMYDAVVGSIDQPGYTREYMEGCILAHQMGLGKTLQSFTIADTFFHDPDIPVRKILVLTPLNNRDNWEDEIKKWSMQCSTCKGEGNDPLKFQVIRGSSREHLAPLLNWIEGIIIMHYPLFIQVFKLTQTNLGDAAVNKRVKKSFTDDPRLVERLRKKLLMDPDLVILDEAHVLKSDSTQVYRSVMAISTPAKIALTGTPLQNNLMEYYYLINLLRTRQMLNTKKKFENRFVKPIERGKTIDATSKEVSEMKKKSHVLYQMLRDVISFKDWSCIDADEKPKKYEHIISVRLSPIQEALYKKYAGSSDAVDMLDDADSNAGSDELQVMGVLMPNVDAKERRSFLKYQKVLQRICVHPRVELEAAKRPTVPDSMSKDALEKLPAFERKQHEKQQQTARNRKQFCDEIERKLSDAASRKESLKNISAKVHIVREIIIESASRNEKVLVFSQSLDVLDFLERMLKSGDMPKLVVNRNDNAPYAPPRVEVDPKAVAKWEKGRHFDRIDGSDTGEVRSKVMGSFNQVNSVMVLLLSIRACSLGVNLIGANRAILIDTDWNPSCDMQAVHRIYRFGQEKTCYIYRLIAAGTIEEKIYRRQNFKQSLHKRVLQDQQSDRNFRETLSHSRLIEYEQPGDGMTVNLKPLVGGAFHSTEYRHPWDKLLQKVVTANRSIICDVSDHDTLLQNRNEPELTDNEKALAYIEDECEDTGQDFTRVLDVARPTIADLLRKSPKYKKYVDHGFTSAHFESTESLTVALCQFVDDTSMPGNREAFAKELVADLIAAKLNREVELQRQYVNQDHQRQQMQQQHMQQVLAERRQFEINMAAAAAARGLPQPYDQMQQDRMANRNLAVSGHFLSDAVAAGAAPVMSGSGGKIYNLHPFSPPQSLNMLTQQQMLINRQHSSAQVPPPAMRAAHAAAMPQHSASRPYDYSAPAKPSSTRGSLSELEAMLIPTVGDAQTIGFMHIIGSIKMQFWTEVGASMDVVRARAGMKMSEMYPPNGNAVNIRPFVFVSREVPAALRPVELQRGLILYTTPNWRINKEEVDRYVSQIDGPVKSVVYTGGGQMTVHFAGGPSKPVDILTAPTAKIVIKKPRVLPIPGDNAAATNKQGKGVSQSNTTSTYFNGGSQSPVKNVDVVDKIGAAIDSVIAGNPVMKQIERSFVVSSRSSNHSGSSGQPKPRDPAASTSQPRDINSGCEQALQPYYMPASSRGTPVPGWDRLEDALTEVERREQRNNAGSKPQKTRPVVPSPPSDVQKANKVLTSDTGIRSSYPSGKVAASIDTQSSAYEVKPSAGQSNRTASIAGAGGGGNRTLAAADAALGSGHSSRHSVASDASSSSRKKPFFRVSDNQPQANNRHATRPLQVADRGDKPNSLLNPREHTLSTNHRPGNQRMPPNVTQRPANITNATARLASATQLASKRHDQHARIPAPSASSGRAVAAYADADDDVICFDSVRSDNKNRPQSDLKALPQTANGLKPGISSKLKRASIKAGEPFGSNAAEPPLKTFFGSMPSSASNSASNNNSASDRQRLRSANPKPAGLPAVPAAPLHKVTLQTALRPELIQQHYWQKTDSVANNSARHGGEHSRQRHAVALPDHAMQHGKSNRNRDGSPSSGENRAAGRRQSKPPDRLLIQPSS